MSNGKTEFEVVTDFKDIGKFNIASVDVCNTTNGTRTNCFRITWQDKFNRTHIMMMNKSQIDQLSENINSWKAEKQIEALNET